MARAYTQPSSASAPLRMSYEEWYAWYGTDDLSRGEWVQGEVVLFMPPLVAHMRIIRLLFTLMTFYAGHRRLGEVFAVELELRLPSSQSARLPDICFISHSHADRLTTHRLEGYADLVVEVVSTDSVTRDRRQKFAEYQLAGIPEYWIIDSRPRHQGVVLHLLDANGQYQATAPDSRGRLHSRALPGFWINPDWLWQEEPPDPLQLLNEILAEE